MISVLLVNIQNNKSNLKTLKTTCGRSVCRVWWLCVGVRCIMVWSYHIQPNFISVCMCVCVCVCAYVPVLLHYSITPY